MLWRDCKDAQAGKKGSLKDEKAVIVAGFAGEVASNSLEQQRFISQSGRKSTGPIILKGKEGEKKCKRLRGQRTTF